MPSLAYPSPPTSDQVDDYHGTPIRDPYRPLEDPQAPPSRAWIHAENALTESILENVPQRAEIRARLAELWRYPRASAPWRRGDRWFQLRNSGVEDQDVLWTSAEPGGEGSVVLDPNRISATGTTAISSVAVSESGELVACGLSDAGSDWQTWTVYRAATGEELRDEIPWSKFSGAAWTHDDAGFFYCRFPTPVGEGTFDAPNRNMELRYHRIGADPSEDRLVFATPDQPDWGFLAEVSEDGTLLVVTVWRGTDPETRIYVADLSAGVEAAEVRPLLDAADAFYWQIATIGRTVYLKSDLGAPLGRVIAVDVDDPGSIREIVPEGDGALEQAQLVGNRLAAVTLRDAHSRLSIFELDGTPVGEVALPALGTIEAMEGRPEDQELFLTFMTFASSRTVLGVAMAEGSVREIGRPDLPWDPDAYVTEQVFVTSDDGTQVPLFLTHRRDVIPSGDVRTLLYGYGGFQVAIGPLFKPEFLAWMERGGLLAVASLRGGYEYGKAWHDAGRLANKQNVFDDFAAAARWLAASGWTGRERIGITGRSNGGLLVGASITQHPELFGAAIAEVGVMDMLRFHQFTIGWGWTSDYGSADDPEQFRTLLRYSPLHNCRACPYPATLITTGDHDDRVVPAHSLKFAATLQAAQTGDAPILLRTDTDAGHGVGKPISKLVDERADVLTFLEMALG